MKPGEIKKGIFNMKSQLKETVSFKYSKIKQRNINVNTTRLFQACELFRK